MDYGLRNVAEFEPRRMRGDLNGYLDTGTSFLLLADSIGGAVAVTELVHDGRHAYAIDATEIATWQQRGFTTSGVFGHAGTAALPFGTSVRVRRFERTVAGVVEQAVTADTAEAQAFLAAGYAEGTALGWGLRDDGKLPFRQV